MASNFDRAHQLLLELESRWISLFIWSADRLSFSPEQMIAELGDRGIDVLNLHGKQRSDPRYAGFTPFHYLQFSQYSRLALAWRDDLASLGTPPRDWIARLGRNGSLTTQYRNDLQHAQRFELLQPRYQQEAIELIGEQLEWLKAWWPGLPVTTEPMQEEIKEGDSVRIALNMFSRDAGALFPLAEALGFEPVRQPQNLIVAGETNDLNLRLRDDVGRLFRVGRKALGAGISAGLYVAYMNQWPHRSSERERMRRRLARALTESNYDSRYLIVMASDLFRPEDRDLNEIELIYPRQRPGSKQAHGTVRAVMTPQHATRHQIDLIKELSIARIGSLADLVKQWNSAFDVEKITNLFYNEFRELRNTFAEALLEHNREHPTLGKWSVADLDAENPDELQKGFSSDLLAFATRQLSRVLFLWFLQQKGWLGGELRGELPGSRSFLSDRFTATDKDDPYSYFSNELVPLFFEGVGRPPNDPLHIAYSQHIEKEVPYLNGGLFRADSDLFERELFGIDPKDGDTRALSVNIPNDLFDPAKDEAALPARRGVQRQRTLLGMLRSYRFTTQESTPDDQSVDPDPELLGKVFENLYQQGDRKKAGAYYTPRELVQFMCRRSLDGYLRDATGLDQATLNALRLEALDARETKVNLDLAQQAALISALEAVKVIDPAVGSGAFLVGMLQEIVRFRRGIAAVETDKDVERTSTQVYDWKRHAITHNLFGVDIQPTAVEICRLRLWLSLVIDLEASRLQQITPLPNLDFRIHAGDSLIDRMGDTPFVESLGVTELGFNRDFEAQGQWRALELAWNQYKVLEADANPKAADLRAAEAAVRRSSKAIAQAQVDAQLVVKRRELDLHKRQARPVKKKIEELTQAVASLEGFHVNLTDPHPANQKPLLWPLAFFDVFSAEDRGNRGFDICIANPPYVRQEKLDAIDQKSYASAFKDVYNGTADIYVFFFSRALHLLKQGGWLAFVTSNKYMRANYGQAIRAELPKRLEITDVIDFGDLNVFTVAAYPAVVIGRKADHGFPQLMDGNKSHPAVVAHLDAPVNVVDLTIPIRKRLKEADQTANVEGVRSQLEQLEPLITATAVKEYPRALLRGSGWILDDPALVRLFDRLMNEGTPLGKYVNGCIYYGIKTGFNDAFVIDQAKRDELVAADPRSAELIKPWLRGRDIKRWKPEWAGLYVIFTRRGVDIGAYPAILGHLTQWRERLTPRQPGEVGVERRKPGSYKWFEIQDVIDYWKELEKPKILWPDITPETRFLWDDEGFFTDTTIFQIVGLPKAAVSLLNSPVSEFLLARIVPTVRGGYMRLKVQYVETFPYPSMTNDLILKLHEVSENPFAPRIEDDLLELAAEAYRLTQVERQLVLEWMESRRDSISLNAEIDDEIDD